MKCKEHKKLRQRIATRKVRHASLRSKFIMNQDHPSTLHHNQSQETWQTPPSSSTTPKYPSSTPPQPHHPSPPPTPAAPPSTNSNNAIPASAAPTA